MVGKNEEVGPNHQYGPSLAGRSTTKSRGVRETRRTQKYGAVGRKNCFEKKTATWADLRKHMIGCMFFLVYVGRGKDFEIVKYLDVLIQNLLKYLSETSGDVTLVFYEWIPIKIV